MRVQNHRSGHAWEGDLKTRRRPESENVLQRHGEERPLLGFSTCGEKGAPEPGEKPVPLSRWSPSVSWRDHRREAWETARWQVLET